MVPQAVGVHLNKRIRRKLLFFNSGTSGIQVTEKLKANELWQQGIEGSSVKVGILDSGVNSADSVIKFAKCMIYTGEEDCEDLHGHGTFMASLISSSHPDCRGLAPKADVYIFKVFTDNQDSCTAWFLQAFNDALELGINILSLSIGSIDYSDDAFVKKIQQLVTAGVTVVGAAGNDGPGFGTMNNPADQLEVIAVGGVDSNRQIQDFSSRGPTGWEIYEGAGRVKPDIVTYAKDILAYYNGRCVPQSGTSFAVPIVAGALALMHSSETTPGKLKQALIASAERLPEQSMFEQGAGLLDLLSAAKYLKAPAELVALPAKIDYSDSSYYYPYTLQSLHPGSLPTVFNVTLIHPTIPDAELLIDQVDQMLAVEAPSHFTSYSAWVGVFASVSQFEAGWVHPQVHLRSGNLTYMLSLTLSVADTKVQRVLWDLSHNAKFPETFAIRDDEYEVYLYDWRGDHPFTNLLSVYETLVGTGLAIDFSYVGFECLNSDYSVYLIIDAELPFSPEEIKKIRYEVEVQGVGLLVFAEWADLQSETAELPKGQDETAYAGANLESLNELLEPYFIEVSETAAITGSVAFDGKELSVSFYADCSRIEIHQVS